MNQTCLLSLVVLLLVPGYLIFKNKNKLSLSLIVFLINGGFNLAEYKLMNFFLKRWNLLPKKVNSGYIIPYMLGTRHLHIFVEDITKPHNHLIAKVVAIHDDGDMVWTEDFKKLLNHNGTIRHQNITPQKLGYKSVNIKLVNGKTKSYDTNQYIDF